MITYSHFVQELEKLVRDGETLKVTQQRDHDSNFRQWRLKLQDMINQIEKNGYQVNCPVGQRTFGGGQMALGIPAIRDRLFQQELQDTLNELNLIIENYSKFGEPERMKLPGMAFDNTVQGSSKAASKEFEKVTLVWLTHHVPLRLWLSALSILIVVFAGGVHVGQIGVVRELLGKPPAAERKTLEPPVLQERIDRLTEGYNKNVAQITARILFEEQAAGKTIYTHEQRPHLEAANRLRTLLDNEHKKYREAINELRGLQPTK